MLEDCQCCPGDTLHHADLIWTVTNLCLRLPCGGGVLASAGQGSVVPPLLGGRRAGKQPSLVVLLSVCWAPAGLRGSFL